MNRRRNVQTILHEHPESGKGKAIPVTGRGGPQGFETSRLPHSLQTIASQMVVRLSALPAGRPLPSARFLVLTRISVKRLSQPQGHIAAGRIRSIEKNPVSSSVVRRNNFALLFIIIYRASYLEC
jgi:hypothetical protein